MLRDEQFCFYGLEAIFTPKGKTPNTTRPQKFGQRNYQLVDETSI